MRHDLEVEPRWTWEADCLCCNCHLELCMKKNQIVQRTVIVWPEGLAFWAPRFIGISMNPTIAENSMRKNQLISIVNPPSTAWSQAFMKRLPFRDVPHLYAPEFPSSCLLLSIGMMGNGLRGVFGRRGKSSVLICHSLNSTCLPRSSLSDSIP